MKIVSPKITHKAIKQLIKIVKTNCPKKEKIEKIRELRVPGFGGQVDKLLRSNDSMINLNNEASEQITAKEIAREQERFERGDQDIDDPEYRQNLASLYNDIDFNSRIRRLHKYSDPT